MYSTSQKKQSINILGAPLSIESAWVSSVVIGCSFWALKNTGNSNSIKAGIFGMVLKGCLTGITLKD